jgi:uncharacterized protein involved in exopolysaccharide biosynthesis
VSGRPVDLGPAQPAWALAAILRHRRAIVGCGVLTAFVVGVVVLMRPRTYTASASVLPMTSRSGGNLAGLAASLGFNLSGTDLNQSPSFYADLATTPTILLPVVEHPFRGADTTAPAITLQDAYAVKAKAPALRRELAVQALKRDLHVSLNARTGVVRLEVTLKDPLLARDVVLQILEQIGEYNLSRRQSQAGAERRFTEQRTAEARDELTQAEDRLRDFLRTNRDTRNSPDLRFEQQRLERVTALRQQIYTTLASAYEQARIEEVRDTPVLTVVEPPRAPAQPDGRGVFFKVLLSLLAGGLAAVFAVLARESLASLDRGGMAAGPDAAELGRLWAGAREDLRHPLRAVLSIVQVRPNRPTRG